MGRSATLTRDLSWSVLRRPFRKYDVFSLRYDYGTFLALVFFFPKACSTKGCLLFSKQNTGSSSHGIVCVRVEDAAPVYRIFAAYRLFVVLYISLYAYDLATTSSLLNGTISVGVYLEQRYPKLNFNSVVRFFFSLFRSVVMIFSKPYKIAHTVL